MVIVSGRLIYMLFDSRAMHSFISTSFAACTGLSSVLLEEPFLIRGLGG
jgi:hypothetical protein